MNRPGWTLPADLDRRLARAIHDEPLPGRAAQEIFAPQLCYGRHFGAAAHDARDAAVIMALYRRVDRWWLPLTRRPAHMKYHGGQVCLPGGSLEPAESGPAAAVRELAEELAVPAAQVEVLGPLSPVYLFVSNFAVTPYLAVIHGAFTMQPSPDEVAQLIEAPLDELVDPANQGSHLRGLAAAQQQRWQFAAPHVQLGADRVWGATAIVLGELIALVRDVQRVSTMPDTGS